MFAAESHRKFSRAQKDGPFDKETIPVEAENQPEEGLEDGKRSCLKKRRIPTTVASETQCKHQVYGEAPAALQSRPTPGNSSQLRDGAAAVLILRCRTASSLGVTTGIVGKWVSSIAAGVAPGEIGIRPVAAILKVLATTDIAVEDTLGLDMEKVNMKCNGIALGHPLGATGAKQVPPSQVWKDLQTLAAILAGMETLRHALLPRRLTQIYTDTKKSYEHVVRINEDWSNPRLSTTYLKLRIQKDRLIAWGLEWADSGASQTGDIDGSLDRAGISDLVESIMTSINALLDEAERLRPQPNMQLPLPGAFPDAKMLSRFGKEAEQSNRDLTRLDDIVRDLTTSIDTLCDLSRSQQAIRKDSSIVRERLSESKPEKSGNVKALIQPEVFSNSKGKAHEAPSNFGSWSCIDFDQLRIPQSTNTPGPSPPSYETVAASAEDRIFAYFRHAPGSQKDSDLPVLLEYDSLEDSSTAGVHPPRRFDELLQILQASPLLDDSASTATLRLLGWFKDHRKSRYGLVYELPNFPLYQGPGYLPTSAYEYSRQPQSLLSFLQHGADTDSSNMPNLEDRFRLAFNLASSVLYFHTKGVTHRNINSNNVLFFPGEQTVTLPEVKSWKEGVIRKPFVASFDQGAEDVPNAQEEPFISSIYRHPRTIRGLRTSFRPAYDLYSLGLILLEIGLWMPLSKLWKTRYTRADFKIRLQTVYVKKLAAKCGAMYMQVVDDCLRAGDEHRPPRRSSCRVALSDAHHQSTRLQTDLYWDVVKPLERCCAIDDIYDTQMTSEAAVLGDVKSADGQPVTSRKDRNTNFVADLIEAMPQTPEIEPPQEAQRSTLKRKPLPDLDVTQSARPKSTKCKVWSHDIPMACSTYWNITMCPKLDRILQKVIDRWESYSIDLFMSGETPEDARPTIYMMCASTDKARKALHYLNREKGFFDIKVVKGQISRSKAGKRRRPAKKSKKRSVGPDGSRRCVNVQNQHYQQRPACGASIGAYLDSHHLPPVTFGGTVLVDGELYGMSVHHMLENEDVDLGLDQTVDLQRSMASPTEDSDDESVPEDDFHQEVLPEALYPFEIFDDEDEGYQSSEGDADAWLSEMLETEDHEYPEDDEDEVDMGDTDGIEPGTGEDLFVTQPAIDDVDEGFFPNEEDVDDEHLSSHGFGHVYASSGIKRRKCGAIIHELDWALIKVKKHRTRTTNIVAGGARHGSRKSSFQAPEHDENASYPCQVVKAEELGGLHVHAFGRTSGLQAGRILPAMSMIKLPGRISASQSWTVMGDFGTGGDSGAWVIDNGTNRVCAHVLAFSESNRVAYIAPMDLLLDDISRTLKATVRLPTYPPVTEAMSTSATGTATGYTPPDTPPPSPPLATSPDPPCVRSMENLSLMDSIAEQKPPTTGALRGGGGSHRALQRPEMVSKDVGVSGESSTALERSCGGIPARG